MAIKSKSNSTFKQKRPIENKPPVLFGLVGMDSPLLNPKNITKIVPSFDPTVKRELTPTLLLKKVDLTKYNPLMADHITRIEKNLKQIYEDSKFSNYKSLVDVNADASELLLSFPYNQTVVERIKGLDKGERAWEPDDKVWRVVINCFDDVFDILGKGFQLTENAFNALIKFIHTPYYAHVGRGKLAKLILRESWFEEMDIKTMPAVQTMYQSSAYQQGYASSNFDETQVQKTKALVENFVYQRKPYLHQKSGIEFLLFNPNVALLDEMGCGKSFQIATAISILFNEKVSNSAIIVAPMSLLRTWQDELKYAGVLDFKVVGGTAKQRENALTSNAKILIIHYEGMRLEVDKLMDWISNRQGVLVFDESQRIKNLKAQTTQAAIKLRVNAARCIIATGTPIANRPLDLFSQYLVLDKGQTFGVKFPAFKNTFCDMDIQKISVGRRRITIEKFLGVKNGVELNARVRRTSLRRLKSEVLDLPPIIYKDFIVEMKGEQKSAYVQMRDNLCVEFAGMTSEQIKENAANIVVKLLRLSQISSNPTLLFAEYAGPNCKLEELDSLLEDVFADDTKKVILWSHYVDNVKLLVEKYQEAYGAVGHFGDMDISERAASVSAFQDNPATRLFIATPQSAKEGLTLLPRDGKMVADTMIYLDLSFDSSSYIQSQARFHRIGQEALRCLVIHLMAADSIDEYIRKTVIEKIRTATIVLDGGKNDSLQVPKSEPFSKDSLLSLLSL